MNNFFIPVEPQKMVIAFLSAYPDRKKIHPKHPEIDIHLLEVDGNAFSIMGYCGAKMRENGISSDEIHTFENECTSGNYLNLLKTCAKWFSMSKLQIFTDVVYDTLDNFANEVEKIAKEREEAYSTLESWSSDSQTNESQKWITEWIASAK